MAVRQKSDSKTGVIKKPRVQVVMSEPLLVKLEAFAAEEGWSVSKSSEFIIRQFFEMRGALNSRGAQPLTPAEDPAKHDKLLKLIELGKAAGIL